MQPAALGFAFLLSSRALFAVQIGDLCAIEKPTTFAAWMKQVDPGRLATTIAEEDSAIAALSPVCEVATLSLSIAGVTFTRQAIFRIPGEQDMHLPPHSDHNPTLKAVCPLSEIRFHSDQPTTVVMLNQIKAEMDRQLGSPTADPSPKLVLFGSGLWTLRTDWSDGRSRWILALDRDKRILLLALTAAAQDQARVQPPEADPAADLNPSLTQASRLATTTHLSDADIHHMQSLLAQSGTDQNLKYSQTAEALPFVMDWWRQSRQLPPDRRAAALYSADVLLSLLSLAPSHQGPGEAEMAQITAPARTQLAAVGAHFQYLDPCGCYLYSRDWMRESFQAAPDSPAGQQAFLFLIHNGFEGNSCFRGEGFENVISRAADYLQQNPDSPIRPDLLLALAGAYRDRVATANKANGDPFQDAGKYQPDIAKNTEQAIRYYREALAVAPAGSPIARNATRNAWSLTAGIPPLDTIFVGICD